MIRVRMTIGRIFRNLLILLTLFTAVLSLSDTSTNGQVKLDYSVIQATGKFCTGRDSCQLTGRQNRGPEGIENDWKKRNCFCDDECAQYGDCCIDANAAHLQKMVTAATSKFECVNFKQYGDIYIKNKCPDAWTDQEVRSGCENAEVIKDPFGTMPVTNTESGFTYSNYYCSVCNNDSGNIQFWNPRLECPTLTGYASRFNNISFDFIAQNLEYDAGKEQWGVSIDTGGVAVFHECYIDPAIPVTSAHKVRNCSGKSTIIDCPENYSDEKVRALCKSYTALIFEPNTAYRNVHCAICNNASLDKLICLNLGPFGRFNWQTNFNTFSFAVLFDLGGDENATVGHAKVDCSEGQLFDPFFKKCRHVSCGSNNKIYRKGRCIDAAITFETTATPSTSSITSTETTSPTTAVSETTTLSTSAAATDLPVEEVTFPITEIELEGATEIVDDPESDTSENATDNVTDQESNTIEDLTTTHESDLKDSRGEFVDCPKFELQVGEFQLMNESSVYIEKYGKTLESDQFDLIENNNVLVICATLAGGTDHVGKFGKYMSYVTLGCLGVSVFCLVLHMLATFISPDLQNLSGKNLFSLSLALLGGYLTFIAAMFRGKDDDAVEDSGCFALAVIMYFFFMASFFWMLVIAFDVCRTLRLATTQLRLSTGSQWKKFTIYSLFAWIFPLTFAVVTVVVDRLKDVVPGEYRPGFGDHELCWFSNKKALLVYFAVPFTGVMGFNIFLFLFSAYIVFDTTKSGAKMTTSCGPKTNFHLYLRLAVIMGITWITGLAAGFVDLEPLWYAFVALNTLQGLFIFVAFTCTKKVIASLKERLAGCCGKNGVTFTDGSGDHAHGSRAGGHSRTPNDISWKWSKDNTASTSAGSISGKRSDIGIVDSENTIERESSIPDTPDPAIPSRYGSRSKTMYTVSKYQANCSSYQNSFDGRYY